LAEVRDIALAPNLRLKLAGGPLHCACLKGFRRQLVLPVIRYSGLGSTTITTGRADNGAEGFRSYPWDDQLMGSIEPGRFASINYRDPLGMDMGEFRSYFSTCGRWLTPDLAGLGAPSESGSSTVDLTNPQSLNRYAYVLNNPTTLIDPSGLDTIGCTIKNGAESRAVTDAPSSTAAGTPA
jgi:RHS repeat-associated protein